MAETKGPSISESQGSVLRAALRDAEFTIGLLTLKKHREEVWIAELVDRLQNQAPKSVIQILDVDEAQLSLGFPDECMEMMSLKLLINRVSDAAPPEKVKAAMMFIRAAELRGCRVINGMAAYSTGISKALHHIVLHSVGGFGAGISMFETYESLESAVHDGSVGLGEEGVVLLQDYVEPADGTVYRVWVMGKQIQCAVQVVSSPVPGSVGNSCMAGACQRAQGSKQRRIQTWNPPLEIQRGCIQAMSACGADCGSIELLMPSGNGTSPPRNPLYFDVNMLSTLPLNGQVYDPDGHWPNDYDPWAELAEYMLYEMAKHHSMIPIYGQSID